MSRVTQEHEHSQSPTEFNGDPLRVRCFLKIIIFKIIEKKQLTGCREADTSRTAAKGRNTPMLDDSQPDDIVNSELFELLCRRIYGSSQGVSTVQTQADWERPSGSNPKAFNSKINFGLIKEFDLLDDDDDVSSEPAANREIRGRLKDRALFSKHTSVVPPSG